MKNNLAVIFAASLLFLTGCCSMHHVTKWEYKNLTIEGTAPDQNPSNIHPTLNELGKEGWTVVGFAHDPGGSNQNAYYYYLLKRKVK